MDQAKMRYSVKEFSMTMLGIYDKETGDFVTDSQSGRKKLFFKQSSAKKCAAKLNKEESKRGE